MEYEIIRLGRQGDGVAEGPVFAPLTLPQEIVTGVREGVRLREVRIVKPSDERVKPGCQHFKACGGCQLQHASDGFVASWKADLVASLLSEQGLETEVRPIMTSPKRSRRRAGFAARRTKHGATAGLHGRASDIIVPLQNCDVLHPDVFAGLGLAKQIATSASSRKATLSVTVTLSEVGLDVLAKGAKSLNGDLHQDLAKLAREHDLARLVCDDEPIAVRRPPIQRFGDLAVVPPPGAFLQATKHGEETLQSLVLDFLADAKTVVDLFAGCGTFALPLAKRSEVLALEGDKAMTAALNHGWRNNQGLKKVQALMRDLFRDPLLAEDLKGFDAAVIDPPRAGAAAQIAELAKSGIPRIAYVSCDPATFARDAKVLVQAGYDLPWVQPVDQFRWSPHIELVGVFVRDHKAR
ncbi:MAG: class I SAM-dependent RNA methyltransferase [Pseudomonadota bacterium]